MQTLASMLDQAYCWLCRQRRDYPPDIDVWDLRFHWRSERIRLEDELRTGRFRFGPLSVVTKADGEVLHLWSARDVLVLKALALVVGPQLALSPRCVQFTEPTESNDHPRTLPSNTGPIVPSVVIAPVNWSGVPLPNDSE